MRIFLVALRTDSRDIVHIIFSTSAVVNGVAFSWVEYRADVDANDDSERTSSSVPGGGVPPRLGSRRMPTRAPPALLVPPLVPPPASCDDLAGRNNSRDDSVAPWNAGIKWCYEINGNNWDCNAWYSLATGASAGHAEQLPPARLSVL